MDTTHEENIEDHSCPSRDAEGPNVRCSAERSKKNSNYAKVPNKSADVKNNKRLMNYFREYCEYTGIHGFRYIGENRTLLERIWWIISLVVAVMFCGVMIYEIFQKYISFPVLVTFSMQETHLQKMPFPAVTICPRAKISASYLNLTDIFQKKFEGLPVTIEEEKKLDLASTFCDFYAGNKTKGLVEGKDFYEFVEKSRAYFFHYCQYLGNVVDCYDVFTPVLTEEGICYSYNILNKKDIFRDNVQFPFQDFHDAPSLKQWNIEEGYTVREVDTYPKRALRIGAKGALLVVMKTHVSDIEYECASDESGYRVRLHLPSNFPDVTDNHFLVPLDNRVSAAIIPHMIKTSEGVKMFDVTKRDCYFQSERSLEFFKIYSQEHCMMECRGKYVLKICGCVDFFMPRRPDTPICLLQDIECLEEATSKFSIYNEYSEVIDNGNINNVVNCDCRPTCTDITYSLEMSQNTVKYVPLNKTAREIIDNEHYRYSIIILYFKSNHIETKERNELYGFSDVVSNFGGLLGLFTGFSILSFTEIIYFLSLRIWGNIQLFGNWSGQRIN
ncbi:unnamed protein product [Phaedon cochleariae]|uniref:Uncharacterized protein n=1 Tax=Phaedon cochleariae TaxID=80249 RepID=A0A9P0GN84_PHACE|nr:unnamed protein product [Phaedon cochleariae]